jgi:hypothetical protein
MITSKKLRSTSGNSRTRPPLSETGNSVHSGHGEAASVAQPSQRVTTSDNRRLSPSWPVTKRSPPGFRYRTSQRIIYPVHLNPRLVDLIRLLVYLRLSTPSITHQFQKITTRKCHRTHRKISSASLHTTGRSPP